MQAGLLYETLSGRSGTYIQQVVVTCNEPLDHDALRRAWLALVHRHGALRTSFVVGESALPQQRIHDEVDLGIVVLDWRSLNDGEREDRWRELLVADRETGFEPSYPPLMRVVMCRLADAETRLLWTYHHAILDGRSRRLLLRELFEHYDEQAAGRTREWEVPAPFGEFAEWAAARGRDPQAEAFWRDSLAGIDESTPAPGGRPADAPGAATGLGARTITRRLDADLSRALRDTASACRLTPATVLQGAFGLLLAQEADTDDLLYATTRAGRRSAPFDTEEMVGMLMVTSLVRLTTQPDEKVADWLTRMREVNRGIHDFEHVPLSELRRWCGLSHSGPIAETMFNFERASMNTLLRAADPAWERRDVYLIEQPEFPLTLDVLGDEEIEVTVLFDEVRIPEAEAARVLDRYEAITRGCVQQPGATVAAVCELPPRRRRELSGELEDNRAAAGTELVPDRIRGQILRHPDSVAVEHGDRRLTYAEVGARVDELAARLGARRGRGTVVGVAMSRTPDVVCTLLAVQQTGAAYVPLDPRYPAERLAFMVEDSRAAVVVTDAGSRDALPTLERCAVLLADAPAARDPGVARRDGECPRISRTSSTPPARPGRRRR